MDGSKSSVFQFYNMSRGISSSEQFSHFRIHFLALLQDVTHVETIIAKCIASYTTRRAEEGVTIDNRLEDIVNKMFDR